MLVKDSKGNELVCGTDYDFKVTDAEGNAVKADASGIVKIVDAGSYTIEIVGKAYDVAGDTKVPVTIAKKSFDGATVKGLSSTKFDAENSNYEYLPWRDGGTAVHELEFVYGESASAVDDAFVVTATNAAGEQVKKLTDEGEYTIHFELANEDLAANYEAPADIKVLYVKDGSEKGEYSHVLFTDVTWRDYFADAVAAVNGKTYMTGYKGTQLFGALGNLSRGQVACILYNMAGGESLKFEGSYSDLWGYQTGFGDVDGNAYYAKAIAWAKQAGVVNGYADGTFHPDQAVTRQEFACMLANYAKKYDANYEAAGSDALDEMSDADQVADFAKDSVAWAVENGVIGNSGYVAASSNIIRADAACMVYNYCIAE